MSAGAIAVVGAGVIGASVAWHLARRGRRNIVLIDRTRGPGEGSTGRATGGFRAQYATAINVRLSLLARDALRRFEADTGVDPGLVPAGYLWLAATERELALLRAGLEVQRSAGLREAREVAPRDIAVLNPALCLDEVIGGVFCPSDGFVHPLRILQGYLASGERAGVKALWETEVRGFTREPDGTLSAVHTSRGAVAASAVVNAAGPWAGEIARLAGVDLPVTPLRRQVAATEPCDLLPAGMPMTIFAGDGFHLRVRDGRVLLLWPTPGSADDPWDTTVEPSWVEAVLAKAHARVPALRRAVVDPAASWAGLYEMSPDKHAVLGAAPDCPNLFLVNGSSGHGVMHAPALGQLLAEIICDGAASSLDVTPLRPSRFAEGRPNPVSELL